VAMEEVMLTWRVKEATLVDILVAPMVPGVDKVVLEEDEEMTLCSIVNTAKNQTIRSISVLSEGKPSEKCTYLCHSSR